MGMSFFDLMAVHIAKTMDRRQFFRTVAHNSFRVATTAAAASTFGAALATVAEAATTVSYPKTCNSPGVGCPDGCGTSRCCISTSGSATGRTGCNCGEGANCVNNAASGGKCKGRDTRAYSNACWTCYSSEYACHIDCTCKKITTCCDCRTRPTSQSGGCDPSIGGGDGRCISWSRATSVKCQNRTFTTIEGNDIAVADEPLAEGAIEVNIPEVEFDDFGILPGRT